MEFKGKQVELFIDSIIPFSNEQYEGIKILWYGNIGFGEYSIHRSLPDGKWTADSEHMDNNEDKAFLKELLNKLADIIEIES